MNTRYHTDYDGEQWDYIRWQGAKKQAFSSRYGVERLREVEAALLALPNKRLVAGSLIEIAEPTTGWTPVFHWASKVPAGVEPGDVCVVGAYCAYRMGEGDIQDGLQRFLDSRMPDLDYQSQDETAEAGEGQGMRYTMAWELGWLNDEQYRDETPEERYDAVLAWVQDKIRTHPVGGSVGTQ